MGRLFHLNGKLKALLFVVVLNGCVTPPAHRKTAALQTRSCTLDSHSYSQEEIVEKFTKGMDRGLPQSLRPFTACSVMLGPPRSEAESELPREKMVLGLARELSHFQWTPPFYGETGHFSLVNKNPYVELVFNHLPGKGWFLTAVGAKDPILRKKLSGGSKTQLP